MAFTQPPDWDDSKTYVMTGKSLNQLSRAVVERTPLGGSNVRIKQGRKGYFCDAAAGSAASARVEPLQIIDTPPPYIGTVSAAPSGVKRFWIAYGWINDKTAVNRMEPVDLPDGAGGAARHMIYAVVHTNTTELEVNYEMSYWTIDHKPSASYAAREPYVTEGGVTTRNTSVHVPLGTVYQSAAGAWSIEPHDTGNIRVYEEGLPRQSTWLGDLVTAVGLTFVAVRRS